jgi:hypothetical protein
VSSDVGWEAASRVDEKALERHSLKPMTKNIDVPTNLTGGFVLRDLRDERASLAVERYMVVGVWRMS